MKKGFLIIVISVIANFVNAGNGIDVKEAAAAKIVSGKVVDKTSGEEIAGAEIRIQDKIYYSDLNGNFSAAIDLTKTEATVTFVSYSETKVNIDPYSYALITVELESK